MIKKTVILLMTFVIIYCVNFFIPRLMPGDPFTYTGAEEGDDLTSSLSEQEIVKLREYYGLDKPVKEQFFTAVKRNLKGDFGNSIYFKKPVKDILLDKLPWTLYIMFVSLAVSLVLGVATALFCYKNQRIDGWVYNAMSVLIEIPSFLVGILLLFLIAAKVKAIPISGNLTPFATYDTAFEYTYDLFIHSLLPITAMVIITAPRFYFTARSSFLTVKDKLYVYNAKARGLSERRIDYKYIFLNGIFPVVATFFLSVGMSIGGTILVENVFAYPGLGKVLREAVKFRDYATIQGVFMLSTAVVLISSYSCDIFNGFVAGDFKKRHRQEMKAGTADE